MKGAAVSLFLSLLWTGCSPSHIPPDLSTFIHNSGIVVHHEDSSILYASFWIYGIYKSRDYGKTWKPVNRGLKNASVYSIRMNPENPHVLVIGTHAGGIYKTENGAKKWTEINSGLTNSTIWDLAFDMSDTDRIYALTSVGLFLTENGGKQWNLLPGGIPGPLPDQQMTLFMVPSRVKSSGTLLLQNGGFLFRRQGDFQLKEGFSSFWSEPVLENMTRIRAMPVAYDPENHRIVAGTEEGVMASLNGGATWILQSKEIRNVNWIVVDPHMPNVWLVGTDGNGIFKTVDGGKQFKPSNHGLIGPTSRKIFGLAMDPNNGQRIYAASHSIGLFRTENGGKNWKPPERFPVPTLIEIARQTKKFVMANRTPTEKPPDEFKIHCNACHGWTDPALDFKKNAVWRAAPTPRDWTITVNRMGKLIGLKEAQEKAIADFLNSQFGPLGAR